MLSQVHDNTHKGDHVHTWRFFLWLNRFGAPHLPADSLMCGHIPPLCDPQLLAALRNPLVYRILDTLFSFKLLWWALLILQYYTYRLWLTVLAGIITFTVVLPAALAALFGSVALRIGLRQLASMCIVLIVMLSIVG